MRCQSSDRGVPCDEPAAWQVEGFPYPARHVCCNKHMQTWANEPNATVVIAPIRGGRPASSVTVEVGAWTDTEGRL